MGAGRESTTLFVGLNESPYEKVGKFKNLLSLVRIIGSLNESPYEKVGKYVVPRYRDTGAQEPQ